MNHFCFHKSLFQKRRNNLEKKPAWTTMTSFPVKKEDDANLTTTKMEIKEEPLTSSKPGSSSKGKHKSSDKQQSGPPSKEAKAESGDQAEKLIDGKTKEEIETEERERMQWVRLIFGRDLL